jgi:G protein-coupled receptor 157
MEAKCPDNNETYPSLTDPIILATQTTGGITCLLAILGSSLIILTYAAFKDLRTPARQLLVSLSVADILIAASHFVGLFANYERFISVDEEGVTFVSNSSFLDDICITQAAITMYGTLASFLLSMLIALYLLVLTQSKSVKPARYLIPIIYVVSWGIPLLLVAVVAGIQSFGYEPLSNPGMGIIIILVIKDPNF